MSLVLKQTNQVVYHTRDVGGKPATLSVWVPNTVTDPAAAGPEAIRAALQATTNNAVDSVQLKIAAVEAAPGTPSSGSFDRVQDKLLLEAVDSEGVKITYQIPAPLSSNLMTDNYHADFTSTGLTDLAAALAAVALSAEGNTFDHFTNGYRRRPPRLVKQ